MEEIPGRVVFKDVWTQRARFVFAISLVLLFLIYFWPTFWAYDHHEGKLIRYNRLEPSAIQVMTDYGWQYVRSREPRTANQILKEYGIDTLSTDSARRPKPQRVP
jgi:hypothetical protein